MKLLIYLLLVVLCGCVPPPDYGVSQYKAQGDCVMQEAAKARAHIDARLIEAKNAYDTKQITYAEYLNLKNNIEILRNQYDQNLSNQLDQAYYQSEH